MKDLEEALKRVRAMTPEQRSEFEDQLLVEMPEGTSELDNNSLYGCLSGDSSSLDACVPSCLSGYKFQNMASCSKRVYVRDVASGQLVLKNDANTDRAYVYLGADDKISTRETRFLGKNGVRELFIYRKTDDAQYEHHSAKYEHTETLILRIKRGKKLSVDVGASPAYILALIFLILVVFLIFCLIASCSASEPDRSPCKLDCSS